MATNNGATNQEKSQGPSGQEETPTPNQNQTPAAPTTPAPAASPPPVRDWLLFILCWVRCVAPIVEVAYGIISGIFYIYSDRYDYPGIYFDLELVRDVTVAIIVTLFLSFFADLFICVPGGNAYGVRKAGLWCWLPIHVVCLVLSSVQLTFVHLYIYNPVALSHYNHTADFDHKWSWMESSQNDVPGPGGTYYTEYEYRTTPPCQDSKTHKAIMCPKDPVPLPDPYVYAGFLMWFGILFLVIRLGNILFISLLSRVMSKDPRSSAPAPAAVGGQGGNGWMRRLSLGFGHPQQPRPQPGQFYPPPGQNQPRYWQQQRYPGPTAQYAMQHPGPPQYPMQPQPPPGPPQYPLQPRPLPPGPAQGYPPQPQPLPPPAPPKDVRQSQQQPPPPRTPYTPSYPPPAEPGPASIATASSPAPEPEGWISGALISSAKPSTASTSASSFPEYFN